MSENILTLTENDPRRVAAPCPYFEKCGGCSLQHVNEETYRDWKIEKIRLALERTYIDVEKWEEPVFLPAATRRRTTMAAIKTTKGLVLGYNEEKSHNIVDVNKCVVLAPELDAKIQAMRPYLLRLLPDKKSCDITIQYAGGAFDVLLTGDFKFGYEQHEAIGNMAESLDLARISLRAKDFAPIEPLLTRKIILKKFGTITVELPPVAFLQASEAGEKVLTEIVMRYAGDAKNIADLFCGSGTFAGMLAGAAKVTAIDSAEDTIAGLQKAAKGTAIKAERRNLFKNPLTAQELAAFDCVVFDPPRAGAKEQAYQMAQAHIPKIVAVSCNPATFARDAKILQEGGYKLRSVTVVDQFVWSAHVEIAGLFTP